MREHTNRGTGIDKELLVGGRVLEKNETAEGIDLSTAVT